MEYINADAVLPEELLKEVQKYINGGMIYIPMPKGSRKGWGVNSGHRTYLTQRNDQIRERFLQGTNIDQLSDHYFLSCESIKKIVYKKLV